MEDGVKIPDYMVNVSDKWYQNMKRIGKKGEWVHVDKLEKFLERQMIVSRMVKSKVSFDKMLKQAQVRWKD